MLWPPDIKTLNFVLGLFPLPGALPLPFILLASAVCRNWFASSRVDEGMALAQVHG